MMIVALEFWSVDLKSLWATLLIKIFFYISVDKELLSKKPSERDLAEAHAATSSRAQAHSGQEADNPKTEERVRATAEGREGTW